MGDQNHEGSLVGVGEEVVGQGGGVVDHGRDHQVRHLIIIIYIILLFNNNIIIISLIIRVRGGS